MSALNEEGQGGNNDKTVIAEYNNNNNNKSNDSPKLELFSFHEYLVLVKFFGGKNELLNYLRGIGKIIRVRIPRNSNQINSLTSSDPSFGHFIIPIVGGGGRGGRGGRTINKKLKIRRGRGKTRRNF